MDTTIVALKNLYVALGGTASDVADISIIPDMINAIASQTEIVAAVLEEASIKELPEVSSSDNNKVLTVVSGKWAKADVPNELPSVTGSDNGNVLTVVEGQWNKAALPE